MGISASSLRYRPAPDRNGPLKARLHEVARPSLGYRGAWATLREEFSPTGVKRVHRLWRDLRLSRPVRRKKKRTGLGDLARPEPAERALESGLLL